MRTKDEQQANTITHQGQLERKGIDLTTAIENPAAGVLWLQPSMGTTATIGLSWQIDS